MNSLRQQLLVRLSVGLLIVLGVSGAFLYFYLRHALLASFDADLLDKAHVFAKTTELQSDGSLELEFIESNLPEYMLRKKGAEYFQVWTLEGTALTRSPSLGERDLPAPDVLPDAPVVRSVSLPDGRPGRVAYVKFVPRPGEEGEPIPVEDRPTLIVALAESISGVRESLERVLNSLILTALALVLTVTPTVWWCLRRGLRSLDAIGEQAGAIDTATLPAGFSSQDLPLELRPIAGRLNDLLGRLHTAFARERRFTSDAAHELRTPIAELRTLAEVGIAESVNAHPELDGYFRDTLSIAQHLENLVTTLLALARCESGLQTVSLQEIDVSQLVREAWRSASGRMTRDDVRVNFAVPEQVHVKSDPDLLKTILVNLFSNAVSYTPDGGQIDVAVKLQKESWIVSVSNTTRVLTTEDLAHMFTPFWRKEQNQGKEQHNGLGLSLVAAYSSLLGLTTRAEMPRPDVFSVLLVCPATA